MNGTKTNNDAARDAGQPNASFTEVQEFLDSTRAAAGLGWREVVENKRIRSTIYVNGDERFGDCWVATAHQIRSMIRDCGWDCSVDDVIGSSEVQSVPDSVIAAWRHEVEFCRFAGRLSWQNHILSADDWSCYSEDKRGAREKVK